MGCGCGHGRWLGRRRRSGIGIGAGLRDEGGEGGEEFAMPLLWRVSAQRDGVDAFALEVVGHLDRFLPLVYEHQDPLDFRPVGLGVASVRRGVLGGCFADGVDGVGAGEELVVAVRIALDVDDAQLHAARDGVQVWCHEAPEVGKARAEVGVQAAGDGGGAEDELLQGRGTFVYDFGGDGREGAV